VAGAGRGSVCAGGDCVPSGFVCGGATACVVDPEAPTYGSPFSSELVSIVLVGPLLATYLTERSCFNSIGWTIVSNFSQ
jgi:hypothetical protein